MRSNNIRIAVRSCITASFAAATLISTGSALAQQAEEALTEVIVTGSRIAQPNLEGISPVTTVTSEDFKIQGTVRVEDMLNRLPQVFAGQASTLSNAADGTATVDLRGLGAARTLVLINGRRMMPGEPSGSGSLAADINAIPAALIKRVEVMTGGASATYGADAVAGVVNFLMDDKFEGFRADVQYSFYQHDNNNKIVPPLLAARRNAGFAGFEEPKKHVTDGGAWDATATMGTSFADGKGHLTAYVGYRRVDAVTQDQRDFSACTIQDVNATTLQCGGSLTGAPGHVVLYDSDATTLFSTVYGFGAGRQLVPTIDRYNFAPTNYFQRPDERYTGGLFASYEVSDSIQPYMEFMFMDDRSIAQIAPSGNFGNTLMINCDNPLISAQQAAIICDPENQVNGFLGTFPLTSFTNPGVAPLSFIDPTTGANYNKAFFQPLRRNVEGGPRVDDLTHTSYRTLVGVKGDLSKAWNYDAYYQFGRTNYAETYLNEFSVARLNRALDVVSDPRADAATFGQPVCRSVVDGSDPGCVPYDILSGGAVSQEAVGYLSAVGFARGNVDQQVASASMTGKLGEYGVVTPWSDYGLGVAFGIEHRKDSLQFQTDQAFMTGDLTGQGAPKLPVYGSIKTNDLFAEAQLPIVSQGAVYDLTVNAGYRYSQYKTSNNRSFNTDTYKYGFEFAPIRDIRFRAGLNRAVRAPNIQELFSPNYVGLDGSADPCADEIITADNAGCLAQGLSVGQVVSGNPAGQYNAYLGGTPTLLPERATTKSLGVILEPGFLPNFSLTIDYYDIKVRDAIQGFGSDAIINTCTATADPAVCDLIHRNPVSGSLWLTPDGYIVNLQSNIGGVHTTGIDFNAAYTFNLGIGKLSADLIGTLIDKYEVDNGLSVPYDCAGYYGATCSNLSGTPSAPTPKWRHNARLSLTRPNGLGASIQWRYFGDVKVDFSSSNQSLEGPYDPFSAKLGAQNYFDLSGWYTFSEKYTVRLGMNNMFDKTPPLVSSGRANGTRNQCPTGPCNGNTYPAVYDALGRYVFASVSIEL